jgi:hypothetical protein
MSTQARAYWLGLAMSAAAPVVAHADQAPTTSWYLTHPAQRQETVAICRDNPDDPRAAIACANAENAAERVAIRDRGPTAPNSATLCAMMPPAFQAVNNCFGPRSARSR